MSFESMNPDKDAIVEQFRTRRQISDRLTKLLRAGEADEFVRLAVAIDDAHANYSARDHWLGAEIYPRNTKVVFALAKAIPSAASGSQMLGMVYGADIPYLKVSVGSELAMMLHPRSYIVVNKRTLWTMQLHRSGWRVGDTNAAVQVMTDAEAELDYRVWRSLYPECIQRVRKAAADLTAHYRLGARGIDTESNLWADAVSNHLYERYAH